MKKNILTFHQFPRVSKIMLSLILSISFSFILTAQSIVKLDYKYYTSWFSTKEHIPLVVTYTLTNNMISCTEAIDRTNKFKADPNNREITNLGVDYRNSGYDRGHNMNAADNKCSEDGMEQCFYFSNMTPQPHSFNAGMWENLEKLERTEAAQYKKLIVTCGSTGVREKIGEHNVVVPKFMWKVIYIPSTKKYQCYLFPNTDGVNGTLSNYSVTLNYIKELASVEFNDGVVKLELEE